MESRCMYQGFQIWWSLIVFKLDPFYHFYKWLVSESAGFWSMTISCDRASSLRKASCWSLGQAWCGTKHFCWIVTKCQIQWGALWLALLRQAWEADITISVLHMWKLRFKLGHRATRESIWNLNSVKSRQLKINSGVQTIIKDQDSSFSLYWDLRGAPIKGLMKVTDAHPGNKDTHFLHSFRKFMYSLKLIHRPLDLRMKTLKSTRKKLSGINLCIPLGT